MSTAISKARAEPSETFQTLDEFNRIVHSHVNLGVRGKELQKVVAEHVERTGLKLPPTLRQFTVDFVEQQHNRRKGR